MNVQIEKIISLANDKHRIIIAELIENYLNSLNKDILASIGFFENRKMAQCVEKLGFAINNTSESYINHLGMILSRYDATHITQLGDMHRGGKCTLLIKTDKNQFIYKPVSADTIIFLNEILALANEEGKFQFILPEILSNDCGESTIKYIFNEDNIDLVKYSYHYGGLIFILTLLRGVDFHSDNIFNVSSVPVVIDCESLLYPIMKDTKPYDVSATSLIPTRLNSYSTMSKFPLINTEIIHGINDFCEILGNNIQKISDIIRKNCKKATRMIFKPTIFYHEILKKSTHPWFLIDEKRRRQFIKDCLFGRRNISAAIIDYETDDIMNFDIPYFRYENNILCSSKNEKIMQEFLEPSYEHVLNDVKYLESFRNKLIDDVKSL